MQLLGIAETAAERFKRLQQLIRGEEEEVAKEVAAKEAAAAAAKEAASIPTSATGRVAYFKKLAREAEE